MGVFANATGFGKTIGQALQEGHQGRWVAQMEQDAGEVFLKRPHGFEEAAIGIVPEVKQGGPVKEEGGQEFGINFGQNAPGVLTVAFIDSEIFLPEFEEEFDLPTNFE